MMQISKETRFLIGKALAEDIGSGDVTTDLLIPSQMTGSARIELKSKGVLCGAFVAQNVFTAVDPRLRVIQTVRDGSYVSKPKKIMKITGRISSILKAERVALNFLGHLSGVSTLTNQFVQKIKGTRAKIYDTRKTTPLFRELEKYAVRMGGGANHRFGLFEEILVKDNHWKAIWGLLEKTKCQYFFDRMKKVKNSRIPIEVEVDSMTELKHMLSDLVRLNRILLDNFSISDLKKAVPYIRRFNRKIEIEASGGITLANVRKVAQTGVDRISIGALTHSAPSLDFSLSIDEVK